MKRETGKEMEKCAYKMIPLNEQQSIHLPLKRKAFYIDLFEVCSVVARKKIQINVLVLVSVMDCVSGDDSSMKNDDVKAHDDEESKIVGILLNEEKCIGCE